MDNLFQIQSYQNFEQVLHEIIHNVSHNNARKIYKTFKDLEPSVMSAAEDDVRMLISTSNYDMKKVEETVATKNWDNERVRCFINLLDKEKIKLMYASLNHHNSEYGETITQSDWVIKLVLGTSELTTMKYPLLQLILTTVDNNSMQNKTMYELNKDMLVKAIKNLEEITRAT